MEQRILKMDLDQFRRETNISEIIQVSIREQRNGDPKLCEYEIEHCLDGYVKQIYQKILWDESFRREMLKKIHFTFELTPVDEDIGNASADDNQSISSAHANSISSVCTVKECPYPPKRYSNANSKKLTKSELEAILIKPAPESIKAKYRQMLADIERPNSNKNRKCDKKLESHAFEPHDQLNPKEAENEERKSASESTGSTLETRTRKATLNDFAEIVESGQKAIKEINANVIKNPENTHNRLSPVSTIGRENEIKSSTKRSSTSIADGKHFSMSETIPKKPSPVHGSETSTTNLAGNDEATKSASRDKSTDASTSNRTLSSSILECPLPNCTFSIVDSNRQFHINLDYISRLYPDLSVSTHRKILKTYLNTKFAQDKHVGLSTEPEKISSSSLEVDSNEMFRNLTFLPIPSDSSLAQRLRNAISALTHEEFVQWTNVNEIIVRKLMKNYPNTYKTLISKMSKHTKCFYKTFMHSDVWPEGLHLANARKFIETTCEYHDKIDLMAISPLYLGFDEVKNDTNFIDVLRGNLQDILKANEDVDDLMIMLAEKCFKLCRAQNSWLKDVKYAGNLAGLHKRQDVAPTPNQINITEKSKDNLNIERTSPNKRDSIVPAANSESSAQSASSCRKRKKRECERSERVSSSGRILQFTPNMLTYEQFRQNSNIEQFIRADITAQYPPDKREKYLQRVETYIRVYYKKYIQRNRFTKDLRFNAEFVLTKVPDIIIQHYMKRKATPQNETVKTVPHPDEGAQSDGMVAINATESNSTQQVEAVDYPPNFSHRTDNCSLKTSYAPPCNNLENLNSVGHSLREGCSNQDLRPELDQVEAVQDVPEASITPDLQVKTEPEYSQYNESVEFIPNKTPEPIEIVDEIPEVDNIRDAFLCLVPLANNCVQPQQIQIKLPPKKKPSKIPKANAKKPSRKRKVVAEEVTVTGDDFVPQARHNFKPLDLIINNKPKPIADGKSKQSKAQYKPHREEPERFYIEDSSSQESNSAPPDSQCKISFTELLNNDCTYFRSSQLDDNVLAPPSNSNLHVDGVDGQKVNCNETMAERRSHVLSKGEILSNSPNIQPKVLALDAPQLLTITNLKLVEMILKTNIKSLHNYGGDIRSDQLMEASINIGTRPAIRFTINGIANLHKLFNFTAKECSDTLTVLKSLVSFKFSCFGAEPSLETPLAFRVLYYLFRTMPRFVQIRLIVMDNSSEHFRCLAKNSQRQQTLPPTIIKPNILNRMKNLKNKKATL